MQAMPQTDCILPLVVGCGGTGKRALVASLLDNPFASENRISDQLKIIERIDSFSSINIKANAYVGFGGQTQGETDAENASRKRQFALTSEFLQRNNATMQLFNLQANTKQKNIPNLSFADLVIFVTDPTYLYSLSAEQELCRYLLGREKVLWVVNSKESWSAPARQSAMKAAIVDAWRDALSGLPSGHTVDLDAAEKTIYFVCAQEAREAQKTVIDFVKNYEDDDFYRMDRDETLNASALLIGTNSTGHSRP